MPLWILCRMLSLQNRIAPPFKSSTPIVLNGKQRGAWKCSFAVGFQKVLLVHRRRGACPVDTQTAGLWESQTVHQETRKLSTFGYKSNSEAMLRIISKHALVACACGQKEDCQADPPAGEIMSSLHFFHASGEGLNKYFGPSQSASQSLSRMSASPRRFVEAERHGNPANRRTSRVLGSGTKIRIVHKL